MAEIADMAALSRQAITNLRARDENFPAPVAELRSGPVFRESDVRAYLTGRGRVTQAPAVEDAPPRTVRKFDPLNPRSLAWSVARALLEQPLTPLPPPPFNGAGVYCLYYGGQYEPYAPVVDTPPRIPLYVGRASAPRSRTSDLVWATVDSPVLYNRLRGHAQTLQQVKELRLEDFRCRYLVVDEMWAPLAEEILRHHFRPLWNTVVQGFGFHAPGNARRGFRSDWDELHPGRQWAASLEPSRRDSAEIRKAVAAHFAECQPADLNAVPSGDDTYPR